MMSQWTSAAVEAAVLKERRAQLYALLDDSLWDGEDVESRALNEIMNLNSALSRLKQRMGWDD